MKIKYIFSFLILSVCVSFNVKSQDTLRYEDQNGNIQNFKFSDKDPKHAPKLILSYGIAVGPTTHSYINVLTQFETHINIFNFSTLNFIVNSPIGGLKEKLVVDPISTSSSNKLNYFKSFDISLNFHILDKNTKQDVYVFSSQTGDNTSRTLSYLKIPAQARHYLDVTLGYYDYSDVLWKDSYEFVSTDGYILDDTHVNMRTRAIQIGINYGKVEYVRGNFGKRKKQQIKSRNMYFQLLYAPNTKLESVKYPNEVLPYEIDKTESALKERKLGFKTGITVNHLFLASYLGLVTGAEINYLPGIDQFPKEFFNLGARFFIQLSLNFIKKNGKKVEL